MAKVFLSLGSNIGDRIKHLTIANMMIKDKIGSVINSSSIYLTEPWGFNTQNYFLNQLIVLQTLLSPEEILQQIKTIENIMGRTRNSKSYESRIIDIDILFYDQIIVNDPDLTIPHPLLHKRKFVLIPLCEIQPDMIHPVYQTGIKELLDICNDSSRVEIYKERTSKSYT